MHAKLIGLVLLTGLLTVPSVDADSTILHIKRSGASTTAGVTVSFADDFQMFLRGTTGQAGAAATAVDALSGCSVSGTSITCTSNGADLIDDVLAIVESAEIAEFRLTHPNNLVDGDYRSYEFAGGSLEIYLLSSEVDYVEGEINEAHSLTDEGPCSLLLDDLLAVTGCGGAAADCHCLLWESDPGTDWWEVINRIGDCLNVINSGLDLWERIGGGS